MEIEDWTVRSFFNAIPGARTHWSAVNNVNGKRIKAGSRRDLMRKLDACNDGAVSPMDAGAPPGAKCWTCGNHPASPECFCLE